MQNIITKNVFKICVFLALCACDKQKAYEYYANTYCTYGTCVCVSEREVERENKRAVLILIFCILSGKV